MTACRHPRSTFTAHQVRLGLTLAGTTNQAAWRTKTIREEGLVCQLLSSRVKLSCTQPNNNPTNDKHQQQSQDKKTQVKPALMQRDRPKAGRAVRLVVGLDRIVTQVDFGVPSSIFCGLQSKPAVAPIVNLQQENNCSEKCVSVPPTTSSMLFTLTMRLKADLRLSIDNR